MPPIGIELPIVPDNRQAEVVNAVLFGDLDTILIGGYAAVKALFMTVWCPDSRSVESNCGIPRG